MKVLIVEDEKKLAAYLQQGLQEEGFAVDVAHDGVDGLHLALEVGYDLIVLDRMLPGIDGLALLAALRRTRSTAVLMLSARQHIDDRVEGLRAGADDYLVKPFAFSELVARVEALLRRAHPAAASSEPSLLRLADLTMDVIRQRAERSGRRLDLTAQEFKLLRLFLNRKGEVLSRAEIADRVWDVNFDRGTNVIEVAVKRLRLKLDAPFDRPLLHTIRGVGYVLDEAAS
jgi:heavy metal response regulator